MYNILTIFVVSSWIYCIRVQQNVRLPSPIRNPSSFQLKYRPDLQNGISKTVSPVGEGFGVVVSTGFFGVGRRSGCNPVREPISVGSKSAPGLPKNPSGRACCFRGSGGKAP